MDPFDALDTKTNKPSSLITLPRILSIKQTPAYQYKESSPTHTGMEDKEDHIWQGGTQSAPPPPTLRNEDDIPRSHWHTRRRSPHRQTHSLHSLLSGPAMKTQILERKKEK